MSDFYADVDNAICDMRANPTPLTAFEDLAITPWDILDYEEELVEIADRMGWSYDSVIDDWMRYVVEDAEGDGERAVEFIRNDAFEGECDSLTEAHMNPFSHWD